MRKLLLIPLVIGACLMAAPYLQQNDARCLHCNREFYAGTGYVMCKGCSRAMLADHAKQYFKRRPDVPFLFAPTVKVNGPVPSYVTER